MKIYNDGIIIIKYSNNFQQSQIKYKKLKTNKQIKNAVPKIYRQPVLKADLSSDIKTCIFENHILVVVQQFPEIK